MADAPDGDSLRVDLPDGCQEQHGVVVVFGLLERADSVAGSAFARAPAAVVVDESGNAFRLEVLSPVRNVVLFEQGQLWKLLASADVGKAVVSYSLRHDDSWQTRAVTGGNCEVPTENDSVSSVELDSRC